jgi:threonine/homoserine/homoserine lactone efflux protein
MDLVGFAVTVVLITASGALAPGPLLFATISHGTTSGAKGGLIFSVAHSVVEFSLIMLFALGLLTIVDRPHVTLVIGVAGGALLIAFGMLQIRRSFASHSQETIQRTPSSRQLFFIGLAFTGFNPYFIIWWLSVGAQLIVISLEFAGLIGVVFMYICHVWMDYVWLTAIAYFARRGTNLLGVTWYRLLMVAFGVVLIYFGAAFFIDALNL